VKSDVRNQKAEGRTGFVAFVSSLLLLLLVSSVHGYTLKTVVLDGGGAALSSSGYRMNVSLSQSFASGWLAAASYGGVIGFWHGPWVSGGVAQAVEPAPSAYGVSGAFPSPSSGETRVRFSIPVAVHVGLKLHDITGRPVLTLHDGNARAGVSDCGFRVSSLSAGVYFLRFEAGDFVAVRPVVVAR
jgi:hypothetical protein